MTLATAYWCILLAVLLPYLWVVVAKASGSRYDNRNPRAWLAKQENPRIQRAVAAQHNAFEALPAFVAGVALAQLADVAAERIAALAITFVVFRVLHGLAYLFDRALLRSLVWFGGFLCVLALLVLAASSTGGASGIG